MAGFEVSTEAWNRGTLSRSPPGDPLRVNPMAVCELRQRLPTALPALDHDPRIGHPPVPSPGSCSKGRKGLHYSRWPTTLLAAILKRASASSKGRLTRHIPAWSHQ